MSALEQKKGTVYTAAGGAGGHQGEGPVYGQTTPNAPHLS